MEFSGYKRNSSGYFFYVQNSHWSETFHKELNREAGMAAGRALIELQKKATARGADGAAFLALLMSALEAVVFRRYLSGTLPRRLLAETLADLDRSIRAIEEFKDRELRPSQDIPKEMLYDFPYELPKLHAWVALFRLLQRKREYRPFLLKQLAAYGSNGDAIKPDKQDTFAVARLRAGVRTFTGRYHDPQICQLLEVASRAAGRFEDWNPDKLRKIAHRFWSDYQWEPDLLRMALFNMKRQVTPEKLWASQAE